MSSSALRRRSSSVSSVGSIREPLIERARLLRGGGKTLGAIDLHVASRVREQRILLGISQQQLAAALDVTFQHVYKYEQGKNRISAGRLYAFGKVLSVPITFFFEGYYRSITTSCAS